MTDRDAAMAWAWVIVLAIASVSFGTWQRSSAAGWFMFAAVLLVSDWVSDIRKALKP